MGENIRVMKSSHRRSPNRPTCHNNVHMCKSEFRKKTNGLALVACTGGNAQL